MRIKIVCKDKNLLPKYQTKFSAGVDLCSIENITINPGEVHAVATGLFLEIPIGYEGQIRSRSGLAMKQITVLNAPGTIDSDYRGEIKVILRNSSHHEFQITYGMRIAQLIFSKYEIVQEFIVVDTLDETERGFGGFGSTGL
jgi:dUTP pyrophosphatase